MMRLWRERRGAVGVLIACALPLLIGMAAFAVDLGMVTLDSRRLQGVADAAALAAAGGMEAGDQDARALVAASWNAPVVVATERGRYDAAQATRFTTAGDGDAVRVRLETRSPTPFASVFGIDAVTVARTATARRQRSAAFSIGSRLIGIDPFILNQLLAGLGMRAPALSVMDYRSLGGETIDVFALLAELRLRGLVSAGPYGVQLSSTVPLGSLFDAIATTLSKTGANGAAGAMRQLAAAAPARSVTLSALIDAGPLATQTSGGSARLPAMTLVTALLETGRPRQVALDLGTGVPGLASTKLWLAIGERAQQSPLLAITASGTPVLRTAQARLFLRARIAPAPLPGLPAPVAVEFPLLVEAAGAEGRLKAIDCAAGRRSVTLEGRVDPLTVSLGSVDPAKLDDFSTRPMPAPARLVDTPLVDVLGSSTLALGAAEPWRTLRFDDAAIAAATPQTVALQAPLGGIAASLTGQAKLTVSILGLPIAVDPLVRGTGALLTGIAPAIDGLLGTVLSTLGIGLGEADLAVTALRCNGAVLVA